MKLEKIVGFFKPTLKRLNERNSETDYKDVGIGAPTEYEIKKLNDYIDNIYIHKDGIDKEYE